MSVLCRGRENEPVGWLVVVCFGVVYCSFLVVCFLAYHVSWVLFLAVVVIYSIGWYPCYQRVADVLCKPNRPSAPAEGQVADRPNAGVGDPAALVGRTARTRTALHPSGQVVVGQTRYDAMTRGEFVGAGKPIRIVAIQGPTLIVQERASEPDA